MIGSYLGVKELIALTDGRKFCEKLFSPYSVLGFDSNSFPPRKELC